MRVKPVALFVAALCMALFTLVLSAPIPSSVSWEIAPSRLDVSEALGSDPSLFDFSVLGYTHHKRGWFSRGPKVEPTTSVSAGSDPGVFGRLKDSLSSGWEALWSPSKPQDSAEKLPVEPVSKPPSEAAWFGRGDWKDTPSASTASSKKLTPVPVNPEKPWVTNIYGYGEGGVPAQSHRYMAGAGPKKSVFGWRSRSNAVPGKSKGHKGPLKPLLQNLEKSRNDPWIPSSPSPTISFAPSGPNQLTHGNLEKLQVWYKEQNREQFKKAEQQAGLQAQAPEEFNSHDWESEATFHTDSNAKSRLLSLGPDPSSSASENGDLPLRDPETMRQLRGTQSLPDLSTLRANEHPDASKWTRYVPSPLAASAEKLGGLFSNPWASTTEESVLAVTAPETPLVGPTPELQLNGNGVSENSIGNMAHMSELERLALSAAGTPAGGPFAEELGYTSPLADCDPPAPLSDRLAHPAAALGPAWHDPTLHTDSAVSGAVLPVVLQAPASLPQDDSSVTATFLLGIGAPNTEPENNAATSARSSEHGSPSGQASDAGLWPKSFADWDSLFGQSTESDDSSVKRFPDYTAAEEKMGNMPPYTAEQVTTGEVPRGKPKLVIIPAEEELDRGVIPEMVSAPKWKPSLGVTPEDPQERSSSAGAARVADHSTRPPRLAPDYRVPAGLPPADSPSQMTPPSAPVAPKPTPIVCPPGISIADCLRGVLPAVAPPVAATLATPVAAPAAPAASPLAHVAPESTPACAAPVAPAASMAPVRAGLLISTPRLPEPMRGQLDGPSGASTESLAGAGSNLHTAPYIPDAIIPPAPLAPLSPLRPDETYIQPLRTEVDHPATSFRDTSGTLVDDVQSPGSAVKFNDGPSWSGSSYDSKGKGPGFGSSSVNSDSSYKPKGILKDHLHSDLIRDDPLPVARPATVRPAAIRAGKPAWIVPPGQSSRRPEASTSRREPSREGATSRLSFSRPWGHGSRYPPARIESYEMEELVHGGQPGRAVRTWEDATNPSSPRKYIESRPIKPIPGRTPAEEARAQERRKGSVWHNFKRSVSDALTDFVKRDNTPVIIVSPEPAKCIWGWGCDPFVTGAYVVVPIILVLVLLGLATRRSKRTAGQRDIELEKY